MSTQALLFVQLCLAALCPSALQMDPRPTAQVLMQQGIDPAMLEGMLTQYSAGLDDLENAEDYETVMNGIRGDDQPIESRYQEWRHSQNKRLI